MTIESILDKCAHDVPTSTDEQRFLISEYIHAKKGERVEVAHQNYVHLGTVDQLIKIAQGFEYALLYFNERAGS